jgi:hypothetical protein
LLELFANRYALGLTVANARNLAKELFSIADERDEAISRTGKYANDAASTEQIETLLTRNIAEAKRRATLSEIDGSGLAAESANMIWFYQNVKEGSPMDYKNQIIWNKTLPGLPYPEEDQVYNVYGIDISSSDLGNLNSALVGKALGIPETLLLQQAGAAQLRDHDKKIFIESQIESLKKNSSGYGDQTDDQNMIKNGFNVFKSLY